MEQNTGKEDIYRGHTPHPRAAGRDRGPGLRSVDVSERSFALLTNHLDFGATTIAKIYRDRWEIETFFRTLKQNLKVKTFVGTTANALKIQIWTALIAMLLIKYLQFISRRDWALSNLVALLRWNLFTYRQLWEWVDDPYETPPERREYRQLSLPFLDSANGKKGQSPRGGGRIS